MSALEQASPINHALIFTVMASLTPQRDALAAAVANLPSGGTHPNGNRQPSQAEIDTYIDYVFTLSESWCRGILLLPARMEGRVLAGPPAPAQAAPAGESQPFFTLFLFSLFSSRCLLASTGLAKQLRGVILAVSRGRKFHGNS